MVMSAFDEAALLENARSGDEQAFAELAGVYQGELRTYCYRMLGSVQDAEDAVQNALLRAWRGLDKFEGRSSIRSWLYSIATNTTLDITRHRSRRELPARLRPGGRGGRADARGRQRSDLARADAGPVAHRRPGRPPSLGTSSGRASRSRS